MCYTISAKQPNVEAYTRHLQSVLPLKPYLPANTWQPYYFASGFDHPLLLVATAKGIGFAQWGLIPHWVKGEEQAQVIQNKTLNAVGETAFDKPSFKQSIRQRRCLVVVDGFFEWRTFDKVKYPYYIYPKNGGFFVFGGIYDLWIGTDGKKRPTFSILTTEANPLMERIHNTKKRMPLILPPEKWRQWLDYNIDKPTIELLIEPYKDDSMTAHSVGRWVNHSRIDRNKAEALQEVSYPELSLLPIR